MRILRQELKRFWNTVVWSLHGWRAAWATEKSLRQWTIVNGLSVVATFCVDFTSAERAMIIGFGLMILVAELLNTAIEECIDYISKDDHPMAKRAKDIGSASVAMAAVAAGIVWLLLLFGL